MNEEKYLEWYAKNKLDIPWESWAVIDYNGDDKTYSLVRFQDDGFRFYWGLSSSWAIVSEKTKLIEVVEGLEGDDEIEEWFFQKYFIRNVSKKSPQVQGGWISPEGVHFICHGYEHDILACDLSRIICDENFVGNPVRHLEKSGWIRVSSGGYCQFDGYPEIKPTIEQVKTLEGLSSIGHDLWNENIKNGLSLIFDILETERNLK